MEGLEELRHGWDEFAHLGGSPPIELFSCLQVVGGSIFGIALALTGSRSIPFLWTVSPVKFPMERPKGQSYKSVLIGLNKYDIQYSFKSSAKSATRALEESSSRLG